MDLFMIRHAIAEQRNGKPDAERALTKRGRRRFLRAVAGMKTLGWGFDTLYHSPMLRAIETAELLVPLLEGSTRVSTLLARAPSSELIETLSGERVAVVGHEPWLTELGSWLTSGRQDAAGGLDLKKGGAIWLSGQPKPGQMWLQAFLAPRILRKLGD